MKVSPIPAFLHDCLFIDSDGAVRDADSFFHSFGVEFPHLMPEDTFSQTKLFIDFYQLAKEKLNLKWVYVEPYKTFCEGAKWSIEIKQEQDLFDLLYNPSDRVVLHVYFDVPMYWYDQVTGQLGKSFMHEGCYISFNNYPTFHISVGYGFFLFTNHLYKRSVERLPGVPPLYFEPAAKLNRDLLRNFAKAVEQKFPMFYVEFSSEVDTKPPYDKYGFPDDADDFYHEEESNNS
jgi:hypothetical protein